MVLYFILFDILPGGNTVAQKKAKKVVVLNSNLGFSVWSLHFHSVSCMCSLIVRTSRLLLLLMCLRKTYNSLLKILFRTFILLVRFKT